MTVFTIETQTHPLLVFGELVRELIKHLPQVTSAQLGLLREIETASAARRREIEQQCAPTVVAPRLEVGETHGLEEAPPPPPPPPRVQGPPAAARARDPEGTVITVAGSGEDGFEDGPAAIALMDSPTGVSLDTARNCLYFCDNHRIRKVDLGMQTVSTVAGATVACHQRRFASSRSSSRLLA